MSHKKKRLVLAITKITEKAVQHGFLTFRKKKCPTQGPKRYKGKKCPTRGPERPFRCLDVYMIYTIYIYVI